MASTVTMVSMVAEVLADGFTSRPTAIEALCAEASRKVQRFDGSTPLGLGCLRSSLPRSVQEGAALQRQYLA